MNEYISFAGLAVFTLLGVWAIVKPSGVLGWVKRAHPTLNETDPAAQSVARFVGFFFIALSAYAFFGILFSRYR